jgi:hypothetical protein
MTRVASSSPLARLWQFSLRDLALLAVAVAAGSYSLANASDLWLSCWLTLFAIAVVSSGLLAVYRREAVRAFFVGYALFGGLYFALLLSALAYPNFTLAGTVIARFLPHAILQAAYFKLLPLVKDAPVPPLPSNGGMGGMGGGGFFSVPDSLAQFGAASDDYIQLPARTQPPPPVVATSGRGYYPDLDSFLAVGHCLFGLVIAYLGGLATQAIYLTRLKAENSTP